MGAFRSLRRQNSQARGARKVRAKGVYGRRLVEVQAPTRANPHEVAFHYTKGWRVRRVAM